MTRVTDPEGAQLAAVLRAANFDGKRVLEVGCGDGRLTWGIAARASSVVAFDPDEEQVDQAGLIAHCRTHLAGYKCPKRIEFRDELARTATGKLQKFKLRQPFWEGRDRQIN
jgi:acyl-CoA synthetase (AMP-forming)/AMP-acid ligase II